MRMREPAAVVAILAALAWCGGCGGGGGSDEDEVREVVAGYYEAGKKRDAAAACDLLSADLLEVVRARGGAPCAVVLAGYFSKAENVSTEFDVQEVRVADGRATVDGTIKTPGLPSQARSILLVEESGAWRIADPGTGP